MLNALSEVCKVIFCGIEGRVVFVDLRHSWDIAACEEIKMSSSFSKQIKISKQNFKALLQGEFFILPFSCAF